MKQVRLQLVALLAVIVSGCGGLSVNRDWDPAFDFATHRTFAVLDHVGGQELPELMDNRVKNSIRSVLAEKGFREVSDTTQADLAVGYQFTSENHTTYSTVNTGWSRYGYGGYRGWYGPYGGVGMTTTQTTEHRYEVGSLLIAIFDTSDRSMVYTATGSRTLDEEGRTPQEMEARIHHAVDQILSEFPPN